MASSRHAGPCWPMLAHAYLAVVRQHAIRGERTSTSRQTCCPLRFPRCAGSSGVSSGQGRPIPVASSLGRTGDDDTSSAPDDHTGPAEPELINPGCSTKAQHDVQGRLYNAASRDGVPRTALLCPGWAVKRNLDLIIDEIVTLILKRESDAIDAGREPDLGTPFLDALAEVAAKHGLDRQEIKLIHDLADEALDRRRNQ